MVRETRHLWVGNLPDNIREDRIREHFKRYGRVQNVKLLDRTENTTTGSIAGGASGVCATVAFMDIKSASKAHNVEHVLDERTLTTEYYEPTAIPSAAGAPSAGSSPAGSGYSGSSSSVTSAPAPASVSRYHLPGGEDSTSSTCALAAVAAAPANWRGTNDSATADYCRRGNTPAAYGRYQRNNSTTPCATPPSNTERTTPLQRERWYGSGERAAGESTPSTPGGGPEPSVRRRTSASGSSRSESSSPEPSDTSRASTPPDAPPNHAHHRNANSHHHQWSSTASGRPLAICVRNLPTRSTDSSLKDGLYHEYKKHGKVVWVKVVGQNADRYAVVRFKKPSDVEKALEVSQDKLFFGCKISVAPHQSCDEDAESAKPYETDIDEYHPKATRTLFIGNLEKDVTQQQLRDKFRHFGRIIEIDIKKGSGGNMGYAFCQYASISSVVEAIRAMDGEQVGGSRVKLGFGKPVATTCVWVDGLTEHTEKQVVQAVSRCGGATSVCVDRAAGAALVHFEQAAAAGACVRDLRRVAAAAALHDPALPRLCVDYASRECQEAFYEQLEKHGGAASSGERAGSEPAARYPPPARHDPASRYEGCSRARGASYSRGSSRTPRYPAPDNYETADFDRRVHDELGTSPQPEEAVFDDRLQSVVVSPHRARRHRRDSTPDDRKHSKDRHRNSALSSRRSRSGSGGHAARRRHRRRREGSGSRAGTPLRDELPAEPRRPPAPRPALPMCLPLPKFAAQLLRTAPLAPRAAPPPAPAPASPPRPPSASSSASSAGDAPHSPSLEERIRSLDEKYEKWSGCRALADAPERARLRHRLLEVDINEVKPSDVVRSLLAKRSVFDEDSERLEGAGRPPSPAGSPRPPAPPLTPTAGGSPAAPRILRYPFPSHPPPEPEGAPPDADPRRHAARLRLRTPSADKREPPEPPEPPPATPPLEPDRQPDIPRTDRFRRRSLCGKDESVGPDARSHFERFSTERQIGTACSTPSRSASSGDERSGFIIRRKSVTMEPPRRDATENVQAAIRELRTASIDGTVKELMETLLRQVELNQSPLHTNKPEPCIQDEANHKLDSDIKLVHLKAKSEDEISRDLQVQNHIKKDLNDFEVQHKHLNTINCLKPGKDVCDVNQDFMKSIDKNGREKYSPSAILEALNVKLEKENIEFEKKFEKDTKYQASFDKKILEPEKNQGDNVKSDCDAARSKDKHETEKNIKKSFEKSEKKSKDESLNYKHHNERTKLDKDSERQHKSKSDRDVDKVKEDKSSRHDHHKREKSDKERRKESIEIDIFSTKPRKDDKHVRNERPKKETVDSKRENTKRDSDSKIRKTSREETSRDLCRKDSTDSSASRASHDSSKLKEIDTNDVKEDSKAKLKINNDVSIKREEKELSPKSSEILKMELPIKVKIEKEEKDICDVETKIKVENSTDRTIKSRENMEKQRHYSLDSPNLDTKRKERLNSSSSLPSHIGHKRRMSSQDSFDSIHEDIKKSKAEIKCPERRDSKDARNSDRQKTPKFNKGYFAKIIESKTKEDKKNHVKPPDDSFIELKEPDIKESKYSSDRAKPTKKSPTIDNEERTCDTPQYDLIRNNFDFLATLELRSSEEDEKQKALKKEMKEKKRIQQLQQIQELQLQQDALQQADYNKLKEDKKKFERKEAAREKRMSTDHKSKDEKNDPNKRKNRKLLQNTDSSDSDEPKKHSIFDIIDDEPTYISMYDKVKARSCKNMQKQEEEKRQEKIKAKFCQLKQSRAKREEKKRSSWDEDSDSEHERRKSQKQSMDESSDDEHKKRNHRPSFDFDRHKIEDYLSNEEDSRNKLSRKNSRSRIISDTSDDEIPKRSLSKSPSSPIEIKKELSSDSESVPRRKDNALHTNDDKISKMSFVSLFGKSDSDDSKLKSNFDTDNSYKPSFSKTVSNDYSSESESIISNRNTGEVRKKHKKKQKKYKYPSSDNEDKVDKIALNIFNNEGDAKHNLPEKLRRHSTKKEKRRDKTRESIDTDDAHEEKLKSKKESKKVFTSSFEIDNVSNSKRDDKMEDIFGPLSDDSDRDKEQQHQSEFTSLENSILSTSNEPPVVTNIDKEENRRKKEKRRKEKRNFVKEDENSLDVDAVSKAIEARLFEDTSADDFIRDNASARNDVDVNYANILKSESKSNDKHTDKSKRDSKEKKKKRKRNKEERQSRKDHYNFYDKSIKTEPQRFNSPLYLDIPLPTDSEIVPVTERSDDRKSLSQSPSLPRLTDSPTMLVPGGETELKVDCYIKDEDSSSCNIIIEYNEKKGTIEYDKKKEIKIEEIPIPPPFDNIIRDISEVPLPKDPMPTKQEQNLFSSSDDIKTSENAVRSIPNLEQEPEKSTEKTDVHMSKVDKKVEEKPRAVISQEETADAVAALLGESFGGKDFASCYEEDENNTSNEIEIASTAVENENILEEDAEEMRQAVQNLNASEMEMKPDTPVSDNDLLLIDTDTEEAEETPQDAIEKLPVNIIATNQSLTSNNVQLKTKESSNASASKNKSEIKTVCTDSKSICVKRDTVQVITSTATPVITSWAISNKLLDTHKLNTHSNQNANKDMTETKPHVTTNIVQIKPQTSNQTAQITNAIRPIISSNRVSAPYQVINQVIRPQIPNMQPPTIKIPEPHMIYQKPQGIVISPRISNDSRLQSPQSSPQRSPGQVTVVRMQPPLSPIQAVHMPQGARSMLSPNRLNSVLVQAPLHYNRLPVTPVLAPISKHMNPNIIPQNKGIIVSSSSFMHLQPKSVTTECRKTEHRALSENIMDNSKIILSPTSLQSANPTIMAQNRLISMQNAMHIANMNSPVHLNSKVLINNVNHLSEKRESIQKSEHHIPFISSPMIHVAGMNHSSPSIIQSGGKPIMCAIQDANTLNRGQGSNVIHSFNSQRLLTTVSNVIQKETVKSPPSVLSMANMRQPSVLTKLDTSTGVAITYSNPNVVMTPLLLKTSNISIPSTIKINPLSEKDNLESQSQALNAPSLVASKLQSKDDNIKSTPNINESMDSKPHLSETVTDIQKDVSKCETDFEELLKDETSKIKVTNDASMKLEINVGTPVTAVTQTIDKSKSVEHLREMEPLKNIPIPNVISGDLKIEKENTHSDSKTEIFKSEADNEKEVAKANDKEEIKADDKIAIDVKSEESSTSKSNDKEVKSDVNKTDLASSLKINEPQFLGLLSSQSECLIKSDENDSWSAKDVNIDSVIKKVDSLCNESPDPCDKNEDTNISQHFEVKDPVIMNDNSEKNITDAQIPQTVNSQNETITLSEIATSEKNPTSGKRGARNSTRGRKSEKNSERITRQIAKPPRGGFAAGKRGRGRGRVDKKVKSLVNTSVNNMPGDVYDFHEDSGDESSSSPNKSEPRPRLILTIKSPHSNHSNVTATSTLSISQKDQLKTIDKLPKDEKMEEFPSPSSNTRKSRRLQEKDGQRNTVDDVIEDVVKGAGPKTTNKKRPTRQTAGKQCSNQQDKSSGSDTRKSPRGTKRNRDRSLSDASIDSSDEKIARKEDTPKEPKMPKVLEPMVAAKSEPEPTIAPKVSPQPVVVTPHVTKPMPVANHPVAVNTPVITAPPVSQPAVANPPPVPNPAPAPTPIMKPPKKMISEISAKLASAFEAAKSAAPEEKKWCSEERVDSGDTPAPAMQPLGASEAADARVQSPALPHRASAGQRGPDRATPILLRTGEADPIVLQRGAYVAAYAGPASLPRGAHHPPPAPPPPHAPLKLHHHPGSASRVTITSVPAISPQGQMPLGEGMYPHYSHQHYQMFQQHFRATQQDPRATPSPYTNRSLEGEGSEAPAPPLELRRVPSARVPRPAHSPAPADRPILYGVGCCASPPPAHGSARRLCALPAAAPGPPHAAQVPREADSLQMLLRRYPVMWQGLLALKNDSAAVQMHFVGGNPGVAADTLPRLTDGSTPPLRIAQRMRLEPAQLDQVHRKMKMESEHCILLALPCGRDHMDVLQQSTNLTAGFITYLQRKQAAGIVNVAPPGHHQALYTVHIFPSCDFANENLSRIAPDLMHRVSDIAHLLIVIATV